MFEEIIHRKAHPPTSLNPEPLKSVRTQESLHYATILIDMRDEFYDKIKGEREIHVPHKNGV